MSQRLKGQDTQILMVAGGVPQSDITDVKDFEMTLDLSILSEGYLGETSERTDEVFKGTTGKLKLHVENQTVFQLFQKILDRAARRTPGFQVNIKTTLQFPNGQRPRILLKNVSFGAIPLNAPSREGYVTVDLDFKTGNQPQYLLS